MRLSATLMLTLAMSALVVGIASAQPDPFQSSFDNCLVRSPNNNGSGQPFTFSGTLLDEFGDPVVGYPAGGVELFILSPCANPVVLNPDGPSDANGVVTWGAATLDQGGGACEWPDVVTIYVGGQPFWSLNDVRSPDIDGDGFVALNDLVKWQQTFVNGGPNYQADYNCDDVISLPDLSAWQSHFINF